MSVQSKFVVLLSTLLKRGYARWKAAEMNLPLDLVREMEMLGRSALTAPVDPNCKAGTRRRRFDRALLLPGSDEIVFFPRHGDSNLDSVQSYHQTAIYNPVEGGRERPFAAFTEIQRNLAGLRELILLDAHIARAILQDPDAILEAHMHLIAYVPTLAAPAMSSPPFVHCDSEPVTFAHLLLRSNVTGGFNAITNLNGRNQPFDAVETSDVLDVFTLEETMETYVVVDDTVAHYVSPVEAAGDNAYRVVLLVDYTPLRPAKKS